MRRIANLNEIKRMISQNFCLDATLRQPAPVPAAASTDAGMSTGRRVSRGGSA
jgi:hypothetical protein